MAKVSLKIVVAGRTYPLSVEENEVEKVQSAAANINKAIQALQENYAVKDMRVLLAMSALQLATKSNSHKDITEDRSIEINAIEEQLRSLDDELSALS